MIIQTRGITVSEYDTVHTRYGSNSSRWIYCKKDTKLTVLTAGIVGEVMKALEPTASRESRAILYMIFDVLEYYNRLW